MHWTPTNAPTWSPNRIRIKRTLDQLDASLPLENRAAKRARTARTDTNTPPPAPRSLVQLTNDAIRAAPRAAARFIRSLPFAVLTIRSGIPRVKEIIIHSFYNQMAAAPAPPPAMPGSFPEADSELVPETRENAATSESTFAQHVPMTTTSTTSTHRSTINTAPSANPTPLKETPSTASASNGLYNTSPPTREPYQSIDSVITNVSASLPMPTHPRASVSYKYRRQSPPGKGP